MAVPLVSETRVPLKQLCIGQKRTAFAVTYTFLAINGVTITAEPDDTFEFTETLYDTGSFNFDRLSKWLRDNTRSLGR